MDLLSLVELHPATYAAAHSVSRASATAPNLKVNHVVSTCGSGCCGLLLLCIQGDAKRFLLEEVTNGETDVKPNNQPKKSSSKGNPILGSVPTVDANNKNKESNTSDEDNTTVRTMRIRVIKVMVILQDHRLRDTIFI
nr:hypothetical protein CFP56_33224 [Quercus suber]